MQVAPTLLRRGGLDSNTISKQSKKYFYRKCTTENTKANTQQTVGDRTGLILGKQSGKSAGKFVRATKDNLVTGARKPAI